jgi:hypothetical protein
MHHSFSIISSLPLSLFSVLSPELKRPYLLARR